MEKESDFNLEDLTEEFGEDFEPVKNQFNSISSLKDDRQKPVLNVDNSGFYASYGIDGHSQYSFPCSINEHWEKILDHLKGIGAGEAKLKEILIAIGYFINEFGTIQKEVEESKNQGTNYHKKDAPNLFLLVKYFLQLTKEEKKECIEGIIPFIARLVLRTKQIFKTTISDPQITILFQGNNQDVKLTKEQCACLMAHMFFCITLDHNKKDDNIKKLACLRNFSALYTDPFPDFRIRPNIKIEKLKFIFNYFRRVWKNMPEKEVIFTRLSYHKYNEISEQEWNNCENLLKKVSVEKSSIPLEKEKCGVQISFSDKRIGHDTLKMGSTQHQIMLLNHPEIIVAILFCQSLEDKEALMVKGAERFSTSTGFKTTLKFEKNYADACGLVDCANILDKDFVMIDALNFHSWRSSKLSEDGKIQKAGETQFHQFSLEAILREINKAYIGFLGNILQDKSFGDLLYNGIHEKIEKAIFTGRWGCGTYGGNAQLKFIIQWIAASRAQKEMNFFLYDIDIDDFKNVDEFINYFQNKTIGKLLRGLLSYCKECEKGNEFPTQEKDLFQKIIKMEKSTSFSINDDTIDN